MASGGQAQHSTGSSELQKVDLRSRAGQERPHGGNQVVLREASWPINGRDRDKITLPGVLAACPARALALSSDH